MGGVMTPFTPLIGPFTPELNANYSMKSRPYPHSGVSITGSLCITNKNEDWFMCDTAKLERVCRPLFIYPLIKIYVKLYIYINMLERIITGLITGLIEGNEGTDKNYVKVKS